MQGNNNDLKIELYPDREPRYDFGKQSLEGIIPKDALAYSFDKKEKLASIYSNTPILDGFYTAHTNHYPIRIKPDDIWLLIVQSFSNHVNNNSESLRHMFVNFSGKQELKVSYPLKYLKDVDKKILENFSEQINDANERLFRRRVIKCINP